MISLGAPLRLFAVSPDSLTPVFAIIDVHCLATQSFAVKSAIPDGSLTCRWAEPIAWAISILTNVISTGFIAVKAWCVNLISLTIVISDELEGSIDDT